MGAKMAVVGSPPIGSRCIRYGQIVIGSTYTEAMGLKPGDEFIIKLGYKHIHLTQVTGDGDEAEHDDE